MKNKNLNILINNFTNERKNFIDKATKRVILNELSIPEHIVNKLNELLYIEKQLIFTSPEYIANTFFMCDSICNIGPICALSIAQYAYDIPRKDKFTITPTAIANTAVLLEQLYSNESSRLKEITINNAQPSDSSIKAMNELSEISAIAFNRGSTKFSYSADHLCDDTYINNVMANYTLSIWKSFHSFINSNQELLSFSAINPYFNEEKEGSTTISSDLFLNITDWENFSRFSNDYYYSVISEQVNYEELTTLALTVFKKAYHLCYNKMCKTITYQFEKYCFTYYKSSFSRIYVSPSQYIHLIPGDKIPELPFMYCLSTISTIPNKQTLTKRELADTNNNLSAITNIINEHFDINDNVTNKYNSTYDDVNLFLHEVNNAIMDNKALTFFEKAVNTIHFDVLKYLIAADHITNILVLNNETEFDNSTTVLPNTATFTGLSSPDCLSSISLISPLIGIYDDIVLNPAIMAYISELCYTPYPYDSASTLLDRFNNFYAPEGIAYDTDITHTDTSSNYESTILNNYNNSLELCSTHNNDIWCRFLIDSHSRLNEYKEEKYTFFHERLLILMCTILNTSLPYLRNKPKAVANKSVSVITYPLGRLLDLLFTSIYVTEDSSKKREILATINTCLEVNS